jgi:hypothetical protein
MIRVWRTIKWLLSPDCKFDDTVCRAMLIAAMATVLLGFAICDCQATFRHGRQRTPPGAWRRSDDGVVGRGWPLIAQTAEGRVLIYKLHPLAVAIDAAISLLILVSPMLLAWRWLRSPRRFAFRLSTLLLAISAVAMTLAFAKFEREHCFAVFRWMDHALDCEPSGRQIDALVRVPALCGLACALFVLLAIARDACGPRSPAKAG